MASKPDLGAVNVMAVFATVALIAVPLELITIIVWPTLFVVIATTVAAVPVPIVVESPGVRAKVAAPMVMCSFVGIVAGTVSSVLSCLPPFGPFDGRAVGRGSPIRDMISSKSPLLDDGCDVGGGRPTEYCVRISITVGIWLVTTSGAGGRGKRADGASGSFVITSNPVCGVSVIPTLGMWRVVGNVVSTVKSDAVNSTRILSIEEGRALAGAFVEFPSFEF